MSGAVELVAVDVGGTHVRFALARVEGGRVDALGPAMTFAVADHPGLPAAWAAFAVRLGRRLPRAAAFSVACPVQGDVLTLTNSDWTIERSTLGETLGLDAHLVINDFEAVAHAVAVADATDFVPLCGPSVPLPGAGVVSIVGPGTGLGVAQLFRQGPDYHVQACEGGHVAFAPTDRVDDAILAHLRRHHGRVSVERVVSGPGLRAIYAASTGQDPPINDVMLWSDALGGGDTGASDALDRFCHCLGAVAGDLALAQGASAAVIAGGLGLRLANYLPHSRFADAFAAKGRFAAHMTAMPVKIITHPQPGLLGAAAAFARETVT